jgi:cytochrome c553
MRAELWHFRAAFPASVQHRRGLMKHFWRAGLFAFAAIGCYSAGAAAQEGVEGDPDAGRVKTSTCMGCHGVANYSNVYPTYHVPKLGGQRAEYIVSALQAYKNGAREHPTMQAQASSLSEQDIRDIAAFLSQPPKNDN